MKFYPSFLKRSKNLTNIFAVAGIALMFAACKNDDTPVPAIAALSVTYAVPDGEPVNFYLDGKMVNSGASFTFGTKIDYVEAYQGARNAQVLSASTTAELLNENITLQQNEYYSLYIANKAESIEYLLINDKLSNPASGTTNVRFLNLVPDGTAYDLEIEGDTTTYKNKAFKEYTAFKSMPSKEDVTLLLKDAATGTEVARLEDVDLGDGKIYTIWAKGLVTTTESTQALSLKVSLH